MMGGKNLFSSDLAEELGGLLESITHIPGIARYQGVIAGAIERLGKEEALSTEELQQLLDGLSLEISESDWDPAIEASLIAKGLRRRLEEEV